MEQKTPGLMIAAVKSGSGKTTVTCALLEALKKRGLKPRAFKCGPDYIDPMFHKKVIGVPSHNLDSFFSDQQQLYEIYAGNTEPGGIAVVEGAMGLFDGLGGVREEGSAYHIASVLRLPVILVVDAHGMGCSILSLLAGFLQYDKEKRIAGVILNKISEPFYKRIAPLIESELQLPVLGFLQKKQELVLESRHLGLKLPEEIRTLQEQIRCAAEALEKDVSVDRMIEIAEQAGTAELEDSRVKIGIARDEAFCFYYEENLRLLEKEGAELVSFSPLHDKKIPENLDGILFGGGYPELYAEKLEQNRSMKMSVKQAIESGMPSLAECGGFMYLHDSLKDDKGRTYAMCGVLPGTCFHTGKPVRFGYMELKEKNNIFLEKGTSIKGHEFHYYDSDNNGEKCIAKKPVSEQSWDCIHSAENHFWGFPHLYYPSNPDFVRYFIKEAKLFQAKKKGLKKKQIENSYRFFENRVCEYFPCHKGLENFNCLFCYCPFYGRENCPGNPKYKEKNDKRIKVCTDCTFVHQPENYEVILELLKKYAQ